MTTCLRHRYLGSVIFVFKTILNHITCINTLVQGFKKRRYSLSMLSFKIALIANSVFSKTCLEVFIQVL